MIPRVNCKDTTCLLQSFKVEIKNCKECGFYKGCPCKVRSLEEKNNCKCCRWFYKYICVCDGTGFFEDKGDVIQQLTNYCKANVTQIKEPSNHICDKFNDKFK